MNAINLHNSLLSCSKKYHPVCCFHLQFFNDVEINIQNQMPQAWTAQSTSSKFHDHLYQNVCKKNKFFYKYFREFLCFTLATYFIFYLIALRGCSINVKVVVSIPTVLKEAHVHHLTYRTPLQVKLRIEEEKFSKNKLLLTRCG